MVCRTILQEWRDGFPIWDSPNVCYSWVSGIALVQVRVGRNGDDRVIIDVSIFIPYVNHDAGRYIPTFALDQNHHHGELL